MLSLTPRDPFHPHAPSRLTLLQLSRFRADREVKEPPQPGFGYEKVSLPQPIGFDDPMRLDAFLHAVRWGLADAQVDFLEDTA